jgi:hypothetical protein
MLDRLAVIEQFARLTDRARLLQSWRVPDAD